MRHKGAEALPRGLAALHVHAINPYGFAWLRRVTEEGNDLNRNFVDHTKPYPHNQSYEEIADAVVPSALSGPILEAAEAKLRVYRAQVGELPFAWAHLKLAGLALWPIGKEIVSNEAVRRIGHNGSPLAT